MDTRKRHPLLFEAGLLLLWNVSAINSSKVGSERVQRMTMVLPTFAETKVGRAEG